MHCLPVNSGWMAASGMRQGGYVVDHVNRCFAGGNLADTAGVHPGTAGLAGPQTVSVRVGGWPQGTRASSGNPVTG